MPFKDPPAQLDPASTSVMWTASKITAESRRIPQPCSLGTSLPADWILIIEPIVWAPLLITGPLCDGVRQGARAHSPHARHGFPLCLWPHTRSSSLMAWAVIGHPASPTSQPCPPYQAGGWLDSNTSTAREEFFKEFLMILQRISGVWGRITKGCTEANGGSQHQRPQKFRVKVWRYKTQTNSKKTLHDLQASWLKSVMMRRRKTIVILGKGKKK